MIVTGSPSTDQWLMPRSTTNSMKTHPGLTTTFRGLSNSAPPAKMNHFEWLDKVEICGGDGTYFLPPEHAESWIFFEASLARVIACLVRTLTVDGTGTLEIRPHPFEREERYRYFRAISNGRVSVTKKGTISEWLENISILFTFTSASALDAVVRGIPAISLRGLLDPDSLKKIPVHFQYPYEDMMWQVEDFSQAVDYVEMAERGETQTLPR